MGKTLEEINEDKIILAKKKASVQCKCSNRVPFHTFNKKGWAVCNHCGSKVLKPKDEFKNKLLNMLGGDKE
jgi:DNA-directed RNA polymerase subunit RPC12/RpoP